MRAKRKASGRTFISRRRSARNVSKRSILPERWDGLAFFKATGIVCGGLIALWTVASGLGGWVWNQVTAPVAAEAAVRASADSSLTDMISVVAGQVAVLKTYRSHEGAK